MPRPRITLAGSLGVIAVIAMGFAGMRSASPLWTAAAATVTLALLLTALLAARLLDGSGRAFWMGFALFGWSFLVLVNWDWVGGQFGHDLTAGLDDLAEVAIPALPPAPLPGRQMSQVFPEIPKLPGPTYLDLVRERQLMLGNFVQISRMILSLAFGLIGGWIAVALTRRGESAAKAAGPSRSDPAGRGAG